MTRSQLNRAVARATGDERDIISSRGFSLVDETPAIDENDLDEVIADWDRIRADESGSLRGSSISSTMQSRGAKRKKMTYRSTRVVG
jgi:hypothetical protein